jgi:hypothetical protein
MRDLCALRAIDRATANMPFHVRGEQLTAKPCRLFFDPQGHFRPCRARRVVHVLEHVRAKSRFARTALGRFVAELVRGLLFLRCCGGTCAEDHARPHSEQAVAATEHARRFSHETEVICGGGMALTADLAESLQ